MDLIKGEIKIEAGRVLLDKMRTATDDPKSTASHQVSVYALVGPRSAGAGGLIHCSG